MLGTAGCSSNPARATAAASMQRQKVMHVPFFTAPQDEQMLCIVCRFLISLLSLSL